MHRIFMLVVLVIALVAGWGLVRWSPSGQDMTLTHGVALEEPRVIGDFVLADQYGQPFTRTSLKDGWSLLFIGFTHCPDVCPMTLTMLGAIQDRVQSEGHRLQSVFVSVDPDRDTPEELANYLDYFQSDMIGVTGNEDQLDRLCADLGFAFVMVPRSGGDYTVDHSGALALIDPRARVAGYFLPPFEPEGIAADLNRLLR